MKSCDSNQLKGGHPGDPEYPFVQKNFFSLWIFIKLEIKNFSRDISSPWGYIYKSLQVCLGPLIGQNLNALVQNTGHSLICILPPFSASSALPTFCSHGSDMLPTCSNWGAFTLNMSLSGAPFFSCLFISILIPGLLAPLRHFQTPPFQMQFCLFSHVTLHTLVVALIELLFVSLPNILCSELSIHSFSLLMH